MKPRYRYTRSYRHLMLAAGFLLGVTSMASAADRTVLVEHFTDTG